MRKKKLEIILSKLEKRPTTKLEWEGYTLDCESAATIIQLAHLINDDIQGKKVLDLGCGSGILAISATLVGAKEVVGIDIDKKALKIAVKNASDIGVNIEFVIGDIDCISGSFDTVLMNPPFGSWSKGADIRFLKKAISNSNIIYSLHKSSLKSRSFIKGVITNLGANITEMHNLRIKIPKLFNFHKEKIYNVSADLYRIVT